MAYFSRIDFGRPKGPRPTERRPLKKVAKKGEFWLFVGEILNEFFTEVRLPRRCEACDGTDYCGPLQPAHSRRRQDIRVGDWWYALRVAVLGNDCHFAIDRQGRRAAEPLIEAIIDNRNKNLGLSESEVKEKLLRIAKDLQRRNPKYGDYFVSFD